MKRVLFVLMSFGMSYHAVSATTKVDSILAFTGGLRLKMVSVYWPWLNDDYSPNLNRKDETKSTLLRLYDTDDGKTRIIDSVYGYHFYPRITRNGNYVIWDDQVNSCSWIRDLACTRPRTKLLSGGEYWVTAVQKDSATGAEWVYACDGASATGFSKYPLKADYSGVDVARRTQVYRQSQDIYGPLSVSADATYIGGVSVGINILNVATGALIDRHNAIDAFGCQANLAPDNSYRFFYLTDEHRMIRMYPANLGTPMTEVIINKVPGVTLDHDCQMPRWTNNPRFFAWTIPLTTGWAYPFGDEEIFKKTAAELRAADPTMGRQNILSRFSADYKSVEGAIMISIPDIRYGEFFTEAWLGPSSTAAGFNRAGRERAGTARLTRDRFVFTGPTAGASFQDPATVEVFDIRGCRGKSSRSTKPGIYISRSARTAIAKPGSL